MHYCGKMCTRTFKIRVIIFKYSKRLVCFIQIGVVCGGRERGRGSPPDCGPNGFDSEYCSFDSVGE